MNMLTAGLMGAIKLRELDVAALVAAAANAPCDPTTFCNRRLKKYYRLMPGYWEFGIAMVGMLVEIFPVDPLCIFTDAVNDQLPDTYDAHAKGRQMVMARTATALSAEKKVTSERVKPLSFRSMKDNDELVIGGEFQGSIVEMFLKNYVQLTYCGEELDQARQKRVALMCWRIAHGYRAAQSAVAPDETQCPLMNMKFERRMVTPHMKSAYVKSDGNVGYKKDSMGLEIWWHSYGVDVRVLYCKPDRPCGVRQGVKAKQANAKPKCARCA